MPKGNLMTAELIRKNLNFDELRNELRVIQNQELATADMAAGSDDDNDETAMYAYGRFGGGKGRKGGGKLGGKDGKKGKGAPKLNNVNVRGSHYVKVKVEIPQKISNKERELVEQLKATAK